MLFRSPKNWSKLIDLAFQDPDKKIEEVLGSAKALNIGESRAGG